MDVRCERCRAQYVLEDAQVSEAGLTVQCSNCGHLFRVKKKALVVTVPVKPGEATEPPLTATAAAAPPAPGAPAPLGAEKREWRVRQANGNVFTFKELTTLQKWIVERKVSRDDEISLSGDQWKRLGNIAELATFFQVVEAAERSPGALTPLPMPPGYPVTGSHPLYAGYAAPGPAAPGYTVTAPIPSQSGVAPPAGGGPSNAAPASAAWEAQPPTAPRAHASDPAWTAAGRRALPADELGEEELKAVKGRGGRTGVLVFLLVLAGGGAAAWYLKPEWPVALGLKAAPPPPAAPVGPAAVEPKVEPKKEPPPPAPAPAPPPETPVVQAPPAVPEKAPEIKAPQLVPETAKPVLKSKRQLLSEARRLREAGKVEKALDLYGRLADREPGNPEALAGRGWCYLDLSQYAPAEASFQEALQEDPQHAEALIGLAETYRYQGRKAEAIDYYKRYLSANPDGEDAVAARNAVRQLKE